MNSKELNKWWSKASSKYSIYIVLVAMFVVCSVISPVFLSTKNITNISRQISITTIIAFGETLLIICGLIDLSAGSVLALSGVLSVAAYKMTGSMQIAVLVGITVGVFCNAINGMLVTKFKTPPFIATLAMQTAARGAALLYTNGQNIYQIGEYKALGQNSIGIIPIPVIFMIGTTMITWYILNHTKFGRHLYAVGGSEEAARASGVNNNRTKMTAYLINGLFVGIAGVLFMSRVNAGLPNGGIGAEFEAMTSAIIGGTSFSGGIGTAMGTLAGAFIMGFVNNIMNLVGVQSYMQQIVKGIIIALAVVYDIRSKNKRDKKKQGNINDKLTDADGKNKALAAR